MQAGKKNKDSHSHAMLGQNRQVIFKEDMYDVIHNAHKMGQKHRGYKGTFNKVSQCIEGKIFSFMREALPQSK